MRGGRIAPNWWISHSACWATWRSKICARTDALRIAGTADDHQTPDTRAIGRAPPSWYPPPDHPDTTDAAFLRAVHNHGIKSTAGELVEPGHSICGLLADGYSMNANMGMGNLYAGSGMTPDDVKFVVQTSAAAYCPEYVQ